MMHFKSPDFHDECHYRHIEERVGEQLGGREIHQKGLDKGLRAADVGRLPTAMQSRFRYCAFVIVIVCVIVIVYTVSKVSTS